MVDEGSRASSPWRWLGALLLALAAGLPLLAPEVWSGFRVGLSDPVLSVIAPTEQPLSVRSPGGIWAIGLALAWFGLAYRQRRGRPWEAILVLIGGCAALLRLGNAWLDALAMIVPLARQISLTNPRAAVLVVAAVVSVGVGVVTLGTSRPPGLPAGALVAARTLVGRPGTVFADWRWAGQLQVDLGPDGRVLAAGGLASEPADFWLAYLRITQGHEQWADLLHLLNVDEVVLNSADQQRQAAELVRGSADWQVLYDADGALVAARGLP